MHPEYYAPSCNWASVENPVSFTHSRQMEGYEVSSPINFDFLVLGVEQESGVLEVFTHWCSVFIRCRIGESATTSELDDYYECISLVSIRADVALRPTNPEREDGTVMRVPYGEEQPHETRTRTCLCVMVKRPNIGATVLLLGEPARNPAAYERIGIS